MRICRENIYRKDYYEKADKETFQRLISILQREGYRIGDGGRGLAFLMPSHQKALWQSTFPEIYDLKYRRKLHGKLLIHQAMHVLVQKRFGDQMKGFPKTTLLAESLAGAIELYFELMFIANGGSPHKSVEIPIYRSSSRFLKKGFVKKFNKMTSDPFAAFKKNIFSSYKVCSELLNVIEDTASKKKWSERKLVDEILSCEDYLFLFHKDFPNFSLFTAHYCGYDSCAQDEKNAREFFALLDASSDLQTFIDNFTVLESYKRAA